jgi:hypothetical protein
VAGRPADWEKAEAIEANVRAELDATMDAAAHLSEFALGPGLQARRPLNDTEREVAVALNVLGRLLDRQASEASKKRQPRWEGLADAGRILSHELARRGLPELPPQDWSS